MLELDANYLTWRELFNCKGIFNKKWFGGLLCNHITAISHPMLG
jgi:hypothetical protein